MTWDLSFITEENFTKHVQDTIEKYGDKLKSFGRLYNQLEQKIK